MGDSSERVLRVTKSCNVAAGVIEPCGTENENYILGSVLSSKFLQPINISYFYLNVFLLFSLTSALNVISLTSALL